MKKIGITGSYASGKTYVLSILQEMGYAVFSSDEYVRNLYRDKNFQNSLWEFIGETGAFDYELIKIRILSDAIFRKKIESFIHPMVKEEIKLFAAQNSNQTLGKLVFFEVPLLFEAGMQEYFDKTICVYCSEDTRKVRAKNKLGFSEEKFTAISQIQIPQTKKKELADYGLNSEQAPKKIKDDLTELIKLIEAS